MEPRPTGAQEAFKNKVVQLARAEVAPTFAARASERTVSPTLFGKLAQAELLGAHVSGDFGGGNWWLCWQALAKPAPTWA